MILLTSAPVLKSKLNWVNAVTTNPSRNVVPWSAVADDITVVDVEGRHRGFDSIMEPPRVGRIADDLAQRLGR